MSDFYGSHFEYAGRQSYQYGLILVNIETDRLTALYGAKTSKTMYDKKSKRLHLIDDDYSESALSFDIEIVTEDQRTLSFAERREIEGWLFAQNDYCRLYPDDLFKETFEYINGVYKRSYLNCRFVNPSKVESGGGIIGYKATVEADSNTLWQDEADYPYSVGNESSDDSKIITVPVDSDINEYTYPDVTIQVGSDGGDIIVVNNTDDNSRLTKFVDLPPNAVITMSGDINYVGGQYYDKFACRNFIRLLNGKNNLSVCGNVASICFRFANRRAL